MNGQEVYSKPEVYSRYVLKRILRKSYVKRKVIHYLAQHGFGYATEIARQTCLTPTNVIGAVRGLTNRYKEEESLITLNIVTEVETNLGNNIRTYTLTKGKGQDAVTICRELEKEWK
jgi:predicted transcriptional regulator with HTH domain